jgi:branched-chain amino acid transport system substrate-binding protein
MGDWFTQERRKDMKKVLIVSLSLLISMWVGLGWAAEPIKIGLIYPLSGPIAYDGQSVVNGAKLATEQINKKGGLLGGRPIELIIEDGQGLPAQSLAAAEKLINRDKVVALMGCYRSSASLAVQPIAERNKIPMMSVVSSAPKLTEGGLKYYFRNTPQEAMLVDVAARYLITKLGIKTVSFLGPNDEWGRAGLEGWREMMKKHGAQVVSADLFMTGETNYQPYLTKIKSIKPDAMAVQAETLDGSMIFKQAKEMGLDITKIGSGPMASQKFMELAKDASEGIYSILPWVHTYDTPENKAFTEAYAQRFPDRGIPDKYGAAGYDGINVFAAAVTKAGKASRESIRKGMTMVDVKTLQGTIRFDAKGQSHPLAFITQNKGGVPKVVGFLETKE